MTYARRSIMSAKAGLGALPDGAIPMEGRARLRDRGFIVLSEPPAGATHFTLTPYDAQDQPLAPQPGVELPIQYIRVAYYDPTGNRVGPLETFMHRDATTAPRTDSSGILAKAQQFYQRVTGKSSTTGTVWGTPKGAPTAPTMPGMQVPGAPMAPYPAATPAAATPEWLRPALIIGTVAVVAGGVYYVARQRRAAKKVAANRRRRARRRRRRR